MEWLIGIVWVIACPIVCAIIATEKGRNPIKWMFGGFFFGILAIILIIALPPNQEILAWKDVNAGRKKFCPDCAEPVRSAAKVCRYCGHDFDAST